eukprot:1764432-Amphidinium_carterae.3
MAMQQSYERSPTSFPLSQVQVASPCICTSSKRVTWLDVGRWVFERSSASRIWLDTGSALRMHRARPRENRETGKWLPFNLSCIVTSDVAIALRNNW